MKRELVACLAAGVFAWGQIAPAFATINNTVTVDFSDGTTPLQTQRVETVDVQNVSNGIVLSKSNVFNDGGNGRADPGDTIDYTFVVENSGNVTLRDVRVTEFFSGSGGAPVIVTPAVVTLDSGTAVPAQLAAAGQLNDSTDTGSADNDWDILGPRDVVTFTASYAITQADIDTGQVTNNATASGINPQNQQISNADQTQTTFNALSSLIVTKAGTLVPGGNGRADAGDDITYQFIVTNTGQTTLTSVSINDPMLNASLPQQKFYASLDAIRAGGDPVVTASIEPMKVSAATVPPKNVPDIYTSVHATRRLIAISGLPDQPKTGDIVGILFDVVNSGDAPLTQVMASQQDAQAFTPVLPLLAPGQSDHTSLLFTYVLSTENIAAGHIASPGSVTAKARNTDLTLHQVAALPLSALEAPEDIMTAAISPVSFGPLTPGQSTTFNSTYDVTQANINAGAVFNTATASARTPSGTTINSAPVTANVVLPPVADVALLKSATINLGSDVRASVGDLVTYTFTVSNPGNVSIQGASIAITDPLPSLSPRVFVSGDSNTNTTLDPGENWIYRATYGLTQADVNAGLVQNTATVNGTSVGPANLPVTDDSHPTDSTLDSPTIVNLTPAPGIAIVKPRALIADTNGSGRTDLGDIAAFTFTVTNPGNVSLTNVTLADPLPNLPVPLLVSGDNAPVASLDPGETWIYTANYPISQTDIDAGEIRNQATINGRTPNNNVILDLSDPLSTTANTQTVTPVIQAPRIALIKQSTIADTNGSSVTDAGDTITYTFDVRNLGNVTLSNITISDPTIGPVSGSLASLAPGATDTTSFTATHVITAADVTRGRVTNSATVTGRSPQNAPVTDVSDNSDPNQNDPTITAIVSQPAIAVLKTVNALSDTNGNGLSDAGDTISYRFNVQNTGNVTLTQVNITDTLALVAGSPIGTLLPGDTDSTTFTATYVVTAGDVVRGYVENSATATGVAPDASVVSDLSDAENFAENDPTRTYLAASPRIAVVKRSTGIIDANTSGTQDEGDIVTYSFTVTNTGNAPLSNVLVTDANATIIGGPIALLGIAQSNATTFTAQHAITRDDLLANGITNQATASGSPPVGARVSDLSDDASVTENDPTFTALSGVPGIAVVKTVSRIDDRNGNGITDIGDVINFAFAITNTGSVLLQDVRLTDNNAVVTGTPIARLDPGATNSSAFKGRHVITLADADAGSVTNQATVTARSVAGVVVSDVSDSANLNENRPTVTPVAKAVPVLTKTAGRSEIRRGEKVSYTISSANLTRGPYTIIDTLPPGFAYEPNTATLNGKIVKPLLNGATVSFAGLAPNSKGELEIKLTLMAGSSLSTGDFVNRVALFDETSGTRLARAEATVRIKTEHVFDCGDVIGRVFDDRNSNGYADEGEGGLPGVRVVTVNGLILTTDKNGRFHIPCADIPDAYIGSNYILKLDPDSLPSGYQLTTENPRVMRLTRGKVTKLNFGASRSCDVALDIKRDAFVGNSAKLKPQWQKGVDQLADVLQQCPGALKITYRCGQYAPIADTRLKAMEDAMMSKWQDVGEPYDLIITSSVECGK